MRGWFEVVERGKISTGCNPTDADVTRTIGKFSKACWFFVDDAFACFNADVRADPNKKQIGQMANFVKIVLMGGVWYGDDEMDDYESHIITLWAPTLGRLNVFGG